MEGPSGSSSSGDSGESAGGGGGLTVGEQLPWPSADMEAGGGGGLDQEFEDSLGDFDEAVAGEAGAAGGEEEVDILSPLGQGSSAAQSDEPVYEEGDLAEEGGMAENQSIAQRAATGGGEGEALPPRAAGRRAVPRANNPVDSSPKARLPPRAVAAARGPCRETGP